MTEIMEYKYLHLLPDSALPKPAFDNPFAAVVIIEADVSGDWRTKVSRWLVDNECLYMMAWGKDSSLWDDSVDHASMEDWNYEEIPDDRFVMTTWHENQTLEEVLFFAQHSAHHDYLNHGSLLLIDISASSRKEYIFEELEKAKNLHTNHEKC